MNRVNVMERLKRFEGNIPHMYQCTGGKVTIGVGHAMESAADAGKLAWLFGETSATSEQVAADFAKIAQAQQDKVASFYKTFCHCRMGEDEIDRLLEHDLERFENMMIANFPRWATYPGPAQEALIDMAFNLGVGGLKKFKKLLAAVDSGDWEKAAAECHRNGIGEARNKETANLFRSMIRSANA